MSIQTCVNNIINFKNILLAKYNTYGQDNTKTQYYLNLLNSTDILNSIPDLTSCEKKNERYLNSYFHVCLLSVFMEKEGHSLENWSKYANEIVPTLITNEIYGTYLSKFTESDIFELFILHTINNTFNLTNIKALTTNSASNPTKFYDDYMNEILPPATTKKIIEKVQVTMKIRGQEEKKVWGDNDILIIAYPSTIQEAEAICIVSCKTSLRERVYQSIFWATHSRIEGIAKHTFATLDKGDSKGKSEIGNRGPDNIARKTRDVLESTMDRVYVFRDPDEVEHSYVIKGFDYLQTDLTRWREDYFGI
ncbi:BsaWI family type II restriction enzyme [Bacillus cereus group sp. BcHK140]|uniref:BsaWI family type II restriction enzyme n=1 Tax=Bacillus cereus group sp. BcHK140 TaxID=3018092 RepID=UPI0022E113CD|nr:BsaWI family type II restriction enzyme [Bacillus cereus group sp. BcHK140]MDA1917810.1 BsaWI family type II restriction enzyme [Bacillus cereus group sp. BcHK140]